MNPAVEHVLAHGGPNGSPVRTDNHRLPLAQPIVVFRCNAPSKQGACGHAVAWVWQTTLGPLGRAQTCRVESPEDAGRRDVYEVTWDCEYGGWKERLTASCGAHPHARRIETVDLLEAIDESKARRWAKVTRLI